ncbi:mannose-1-phosphate guanylyltransferase/mannose-6-phosphate isomerase [Marinobacterium sp. AK62]|uniref:mannose-1-phosphate guanylyltransferase n=1 Tax=Marinobacterium alkalitolerans TaxID=1542925 RepID=A0ABS3ZC11_9GAMM|nr:mannose-1-phosphate guanylyltransferase/mannose-6-phosphate isomerase [Marinobacterium alkalitolerans]MBP0048855.1 mannose-1-phosphate guanylyltransferase/mannose-6-phosphate isomerase [Marinobacterium alkalitolerans]
MIQPVIFAGGSGLRLWPLSTETHPKQFLPLAGGESSLLQLTLERLQPLNVLAPLLVTREDYRFQVAEVARCAGYGDARVLLEPVSLSTAPAVALAALACTESADDPVLLVLPSDQTITDVAGFARSVEHGRRLAESGRLVTFGVTPDRAAIEYGYIRPGQAVWDGWDVAEFVEKPPVEQAQALIDQGCYWNSGMFMFRASVLLDALQQHCPDVLECCTNAMQSLEQDLYFLRPVGTSLEGCPAISLDKAVMEKTDRASMVLLDSPWSDLGSWHSLWASGPQDEAANTTVGPAVLHRVRESCVVAQTRPVVCVGVEHLVVADTPEAVLVTSRDQASDVPELLERIKPLQAGRESQRDVHRPWGTYRVLESSHGYKVKQLAVNPGGRLSLQRHQFRAEHWVVVQGVARVTRGAEIFELYPNQSTFIPCGTAHALENPGDDTLQLIEVQSGSYLQEDDIERLEDPYGRAGRGEQG